jgi:N-acetylated-alpha-linked acidic dipeptidase
LIEALEKLHREHQRWKRFERRLRRWWCSIQEKLGHPCKKHHPPAFNDELRKLGLEKRVRIGRLPGLISEEEELMDVWQGLAAHVGLDPFFEEDELSQDGRLPFPILPPRKLLRAIRRVRHVNWMLIKFERMFISEEGLPEREWYKHLGVSPGRWLGMPLFLQRLMGTRN